MVVIVHADRDPVTLQIPADVAVVLGSVLSRFEMEATTDGIAIKHPGERAALWHLEGALEKTLVAPLRPDYDEVLEGALQRLQGGSGL